MFDIIVAGGWLMMPILLCSMISIAVVVERFWSLNPERILPRGLLRQVWDTYKSGSMTLEQVIELRADSPLGEVFSAGLANQRHGRDVMKDAMEETGSKVVHEMERFLAVLGTIATISPLMGLLGTVLGMIDVFTQITLSGTGDTGALAGGISTALITTAAGLCVAIPSMIFHRFFERRVDGITVDMEHQCSRLVDAIFSGKALSDSAEQASVPRPPVAQSAVKDTGNDSPVDEDSSPGPQESSKPDSEKKAAASKKSRTAKPKRK